MTSACRVRGTEIGHWPAEGGWRHPRGSQERAEWPHVWNIEKVHERSGRLLGLLEHIGISQRQPACAVDIIEESFNLPPILLPEGHAVGQRRDPALAQK